MILCMLYISIFVCYDLNLCVHFVSVLSLKKRFLVIIQFMISSMKDIVRIIVN